MNFQNKKILLFIPKYFGYENIIKQGLEKKGAIVYMVYENISTFNAIYRILCSKYNILHSAMIDTYYFHKIKNVASVDYIFVLRGSLITKRFMEFLLKKYKNAITIMYQWDSVKNNPNAILIKEYFKKIYTFDMNDSKIMNWHYRPLFYYKKLYDFDNIGKKDIDISFIASMHSGRARLLNYLKDLSNSKNLSLFYHMYQTKSYCFWAKHIWKLPEWENMNYEDIHFDSITIEETNNICSRSKIVADYTHPEQNGFTMRTIESIGNGCKIITNNKLIEQADFYNENNIYVYDPDNFDIPESFLNSPYVEYSPELYHYYSLDGWLEEILSD